MVKLFFLLIINFLFSNIQFESENTAIFFDLGNTLVNTNNMSQPSEIPLRKTISWITGAKEFLNKLKYEDFEVGLITNVPKTWSPQDLIEFISERWLSSHENFPWEWFENKIQIPSLEIESKPHPKIYFEAKKLIRKNIYLFIGESENEVLAACQYGYYGILIGKEFPPSYLYAHHLEFEETKEVCRPKI